MADTNGLCYTTDIDFDAIQMLVMIIIIIIIIIVIVERCTEVCDSTH